MITFWAAQEQEEFTNRLNSLSSTLQQLRCNLVGTVVTVNSCMVIGFHRFPTDVTLEGGGAGFNSMHIRSIGAIILIDLQVNVLSCFLKNVYLPSIVE